MPNPHDDLTILDIEKLLTKKEIDVKFSDTELNTFFQSRIWRQIEELLRFKRAQLMSALLDFSTTSDDDLILKGLLRENFYILKIREILEDNPDKETEVLDNHF